MKTDTFHCQQNRGARTIVRNSKRGPKCDSPEAAGTKNKKIKDGNILQFLSKVTSPEHEKSKCHNIKQSNSAQYPDNNPSEYKKMPKSLAIRAREQEASPTFPRGAHIAISYISYPYLPYKYVLYNTSSIWLTCLDQPEGERVQWTKASMPQKINGANTKYKLLH